MDWLYLIWLGGGLEPWVIQHLGRLITNGIGAALVALGYFLILPFSVQASRSFQPDPGMVMWLILSVYFFFRWSEKHGQPDAWGWTRLAGLFGGIAVLTKFVAAYILGVVAASMVLYTLGV